MITLWRFISNVFLQVTEHYRQPNRRAPNRMLEGVIYQIVKGRVFTV